MFRKYIRNTSIFIVWVNQKTNKKSCPQTNSSYLSKLIHIEIKVSEVPWFIMPPPPPVLLLKVRLCKFLKLFMIIPLNSFKIEKCFRQTLQRKSNQTFYVNQPFSENRAVYEIIRKIWYRPAGHRRHYSRTHAFFILDN